MERKNFYDDGTYQALRERIAQLTPDRAPEWGKMTAAQTCAHCAEVAEVANGKALLGTPWYVRLLGPLVKKLVTGDKPYPRGTRTHPQYLIHSDLDFEEQKDRLLEAMKAMHLAGAAQAAEARHPIFGAMTAEEHGWVTYKHLDHHLAQFGV